MKGVDLPGWYGAAHERFDALVRGLDAEVLDRVVPACPAWTVHDLVAHVSGIVDDALSGRVEGAPGEAWTAAQVRRGRSMSVGELLERWREQAPAFAGAVFAGSHPMAFPAVADLHSHEQDLRSAVGEPGARDIDAIAGLASAAAHRCVQRVAEAGRSLRIELDGHEAAGAGDAEHVLRSSAYELFRAAFGRRSAGQIASLIEGPDARAVAVSMVIFGPAATDLVE